MNEVVFPADERRPTPLWRNLGFQLMWSSTAASGFGDRMIELAALPLLGALVVGAEAADKVSAVYFWYFLPWIFITPIGGWLADTFPRKWILLACDESRATILLLTCLLVPAGIATSSTAAPQLLLAAPWKVFLILSLIGACACVFSATRNAIIPQLVPSRQLNPANAIILGIGVVASLIGYFGGLILQYWSVRRGLEIALAAFAGSGLFFIFMHPRPHTGLETDRYDSQWTRFTRAVAYIRRHKPVRDLVLLNALVWSMAMVVAPAVGSLCHIKYQVPADQFMWAFSKLNMCLGVGMLAGALGVSWLNLRRETTLVLLTTLLLVAVSLFLLAFSWTYWMGMILAFLVGLSGGTTMILVATLTQAITPNHILGRVTGVREVLSNFASVTVNLVIWQLPALRAVNPDIPEADPLLIELLIPLALVLALVALRGIGRHLTSGPMPSRSANACFRFVRFYGLIWHRLRWIGRDNVPSTGPVILAANHTTGLDPFLMQAVVPRLICWVMLTSYRYRTLNFLWNTIRPITLEEGADNRIPLREITRRLEAQDIVGLFPEGALQRDHRRLQPFQPGVALLAVRSGATIVPVWVEGTPRARHMFWHFAMPSRSTVIFGKPYKPDPNLDYQTIVADLRERMVRLAQTLEAEGKN